MGRDLQFSPTFPLLFSHQGKYDEEIEVYKHHLEQTYKLCRPCQAAVEYYIKHQNRQLRALLLSHHFRRRETDKTYTQVRGGEMREFRGKRRELDTSAPGFAAGKGRQWPWGFLTLGAWVYGRSLEEHRIVATDARDVSLRFSSCWCDSVQLPEGKSNVIIRTG